MSSGVVVLKALKSNWDRAGSGEDVRLLLMKFTDAVERVYEDELE